MITNKLKARYEKLVVNKVLIGRPDEVRMKILSSTLTATPVEVKDLLNGSITLYPSARNAV